MSKSREYFDIRMTKGDKAHLRRLADERECDMIDVLLSLVDDAEAGRIPAPPFERRRGHGTARLCANRANGQRVRDLADAWDVYAPQAVAWLMRHQAREKSPSQHDVWRRMAQNAPGYKQAIAEGGIG